MKESSARVWMESIIKLWRHVSALRIPVFAAHTAYFIILSVFPMLVLLLGLLRYTGLSVDTLTEFIQGMIPEALLPAAKRLIVSAYRNTSGMVLSLSAAVALWSASRGIYGLMIGLNTVYNARENRSWLRTRIVSMLYTLLFLLALVMTLILSVFGTTLVRKFPGVQLLSRAVGLRFLILLLAQTALFCMIFKGLPSRRTPLADTFPGAVFASAGWLVFSDLFSLYVKHVSGYANVYGSVYVVALTMLWLYICVSIVFYGGALNMYLTENK